MKIFSVAIETPVVEWSEDFKQALLYGSSDPLTFSYEKKGNSYQRTELWIGIYPKINSWNNDASWLREKGSCPDCLGTRYRKEILHVRLAGRNIAETCQDTIAEALVFWKMQTWSKQEQQIAEQPIQELESKIRFLADVGLQYLTLDRGAHTLSGGESQRIRLASQLGSHLTKTIYVLDEPTIGLHPRDTQKLIHTLKQLQARDNTLVIVEHDFDVISAADHIIEMGPKAGEYGGEIIDAGTIEDLRKGNSLTGKYLSKERRIYQPPEYREPKHWLKIPAFSHNNIKKLSLQIPTQVLSIVTGVSGSGKSSLVFGGIQTYIANNLEKGIQDIENLVLVDQTPIGRSPRSTPVSYCDIMNTIRKLFASTKESKKRGWTISRFTYNGKEGRCLACEGKGATLIEMHFISDVWIECPSCQGARYNDATLDITWNELNIADILDLSVEQAILHFENHRTIKRKLEAISSVGLGYLRLGQPSTELSGGESQRLKLARELAKGSRGKKTCFLLDEPTTGLHASDIDVLLKALHQLIDNGHTAVIIEHNVDFIRNADHLIDLGPEGGAGGGTILFSGTLEELKKNELPQSYTKQFLFSK
jgi:excinuclease ABC subunit A